MKPIKLTIEGLNSFYKKQEIDFEYLTERGVFGIFGATGSGKSTVLDAIILSLYGKVPRLKNDLKEAINLNKKFIDVYFSFSISGKEYSVRRIFNRTKTGINTKQAVVYNGKGEALTEKAGDTNAKIESLIGLNAEDFTRSVVLPQGKFSDFLKLGAKARRDMLERIFNLQEYGTDLNRKIKIGISGIEEKVKVLEGKIGVLEGLEEEPYAELEKKEKDLSREIVEKERDYLLIEKEYNEKKIQWGKVQELEKLKIEKMELKKESKYYDNLENKVKKYSGAVKLESNYNNIEKLKIDIKNSSESLITKRDVLSKLNVKLEELKNRRVILDDLKENRVMSIVKRLEDLERILEIEDEKSRLEKDNINNSEKLIKINLKDEKIKKEYEALNEILAGVVRAVGELEKDISENENSIELRKKVEKSKIIYLGIKEMENNLSDLNLRKDELTKNISSLEVLNDKTRNEIGDKKLKKDFYILLREKKDLEKKNLEKKNMDEKISKIKELIGESDKNIVEYNVEIKRLKNSILEKENQERAFILAENLKMNMPCPVCGSKEHPNLKKEKAIEDNIDKEKLEEFEIKLGEILLEKNSLNSDIKYQQEKSLESEELLEKMNLDFDKKSFEKIESKNLDISEILDIKKYEKDIMNYEKESAAKEAELKKDMENLEKEEKNISKLIKNIENMNETIKIEWESLEKFIETEKNIEIKDEKRLELKRDLDGKLESREETIFKIDNIKTEINILNLSKTKILEKKESVRLSLEKSARDLLKYEESKDCKEEKKILLDEKIKIIFDYEDVKNRYLKTEEELNRLNNGIAVLKEKLENLNSFLLENEEKFKMSLEDLNFESKEEFLLSLADKLNSEIEFLKIKKYRENLLKVEGNIEKISKEIEGEKINELIWNKLKLDFSTVKDQYEKLKNDFSILNEKLKKMKKEQEKLKVFIKEKKTLERELEKYNDLRDLFKANKFVDYIAKRRLDYIAKEASKRLKTISRGRYALEIDSMGSFVIRDDFNGGARRNTATLSGGEQFLTSLSLALALSNHIQLKGNAVLEFFFLDEGFGTLDSELLEIVISSLENIQSEKLHIGLISHVDELKERIERKLIVKGSIKSDEGSLVYLD